MNRVIQSRFNKVEMYVIYSNIIILQSIMSSKITIGNDISNHDSNITFE